MIARYTRPELGEVWSDHARFEAMRQVEVAASEELDGPTADELDAIRSATFTVSAINEREKVTDHDTAAFVDVLSASAGPAGRWIHHGLTSSDVLDTGLALQLRRVGEIVLPDSRRLVEALAARRARARAHAVRRAHARNPRRADHVRDQARELRVRGGTATRIDSSVPSPRRRSERCRARSGRTRRPRPSSRSACSTRLGLAREPVSTQVVPRDRHAELLGAIALAGAGMERFATELRHLARTEVGEVREPFGRGQKGSSSMPHKRNPIKSEQIVGLARLLRGNAQAALEDVALWHERDISHSSVERVILPDSTILLDHHAAPVAVPRARGWWSTPTGCARTSSSPTERCSPSACCSRWWSRG